MVFALIPILLAVAPAPKATKATSVEPPVRVWLNHDKIASGDRSRVYVHLRDDGYLVVLSVDTDGRVRVLYPVDPGEDDFVRSNRDVELRARGDRDAITADGSGRGTVYAAVSRTPYRFEPFVRGDHWDYGAFGDRLGNEVEGPLTDIVQRMTTDHFDYDLVSYDVTRSYARGGGPVYTDDWYDPWYGGPYNRPWYGGFSVGFGFGRPWFGYRPFYDPFYDPFFYNPYYYTGYYGSPFYGGFYGYPYGGFGRFPGFVSRPFYPYAFKPGQPGIGGPGIDFRRPTDAFIRRPMPTFSSMNPYRGRQGPASPLLRPVSLRPLPVRPASGNYPIGTSRRDAGGSFQPRAPERTTGAVMGRDRPSNAGVDVFRGGWRDRDMGGRSRGDDGVREAPRPYDVPSRAAGSDAPRGTPVERATPSRPSYNGDRAPQRAPERAVERPPERAPDRVSSPRSEPHSSPRGGGGGGGGGGGRPHGGGGGGRPSGSGGRHH